MAKPLFALTAGQKTRGKVKSNSNAGSYRKLRPSDWTDKCDAALRSLNESLLNCVVLLHPDFSQPLILSIDVLLDGLGADCHKYQQVRKKHALLHLKAKL